MGVIFLKNILKVDFIGFDVKTPSTKNTMYAV